MDVSNASDSTEAPGNDESGSHHMPSLMLPYIDMASFDQEELGKLARCDSRHVQERCLRKYKVPVPEIDKEVFNESLSSKLQGYRAVLLDKMEEEEGEGGSSSSPEEENDEDFSLGSRSGRGRARKRIARSLQGEPPKKVQRADRKAVNTVGASSSALAATNVEAYVNAHDKSEGKLKAKVGSEEEEEAHIVIGHEFGKADHKGRHVRFKQASKKSFIGMPWSPAGKSLSSFMEASTLPVDSGQEVPKKFDFDAYAAHLYGESSQLRRKMGAHIVGAENFGCSPFKTPSTGKTSNSFAGISHNIQDTPDMKYLDSIKAQQSSLLLEKSAKRLKTDKVRGRSSSGVIKTAPVRNEAGLFECLICHKTYLEVSRYWGHKASHRKRRKTASSSQRRVSAKHIATHMQDVFQVTYANSRDVVFSNQQQPSPSPPPPPQHSENEKVIFSNQYQPSAPLEHSENVVFSNHQQPSPSPSPPPQHSENEKVIFSNQHQPSAPPEHSENVVFSNQQQASPSLQHGESKDIEDKACGTGVGNTQISPGEVGSYQCPTCPKSYNNIARYYGHLSCHAKRRKHWFPSRRASKKDIATSAKDGMPVVKDHSRVPDFAGQQPAPAIRKMGRRLLSRKTRGSDVGKPKPKPHIVPNEDGMFQCLICQKSYSELSRYYGHMSCHRVKKISSVQGRKARKNVSVHPKSDVPVAKAKAELKKSKSAEEQQIPLVLEHNAKESIINKSSGNSVERASSIVGEDGPLQCPICQKSFREASRYYGHIGSHEKGRKRAAAEKKMTMKKIRVPSLAGRVKDSIAKVLEVSDKLQASPLLQGSGRNSVTNKVSKNEMEKGSTISKGDGILQCLICRKAYDDVSRFNGHLACHKKGHKTTSGQRRASTKNATTPALSPGFDDLIKPSRAAEVDQLGNVHDETAEDIIVASTTPALSGLNIPSPVGEIGELEIQVDDQGLNDNTMAPMNIFQTSLHVGVDSHEIKCSLTSKTFPDTKPEAASVSPNHLNGFLKLLGKPTQNEGGGNILSQNAALVENATKPHFDMKIDGQLVSKIQVQGPAVHKDTGCWQCGEPFQNLADLLFCDWCDREFHSRCVLVGLQPLPETNWVCPLCEGGS